MGKTESKEEKNLKASLNVNVKDQIECPLCKQLLKGNITYNELNIHLRRCGNLQHSKIKSANLGGKEFEGQSHRNLGLNNIKNMLDKKYLNNNQKISLENNLNSSAPRRQHKKSINS